MYWSSTDAKQSFKCCESSSWAAANDFPLVKTFKTLPLQTIGSITKPRSGWKVQVHHSAPSVLVNYSIVKLTTAALK